MIDERYAVLEVVASHVPAASREDCIRVAVDGVDGAGKTSFADELAAVLRQERREVIRISVDDFSTYARSATDGAALIRGLLAGLLPLRPTPR